MSRPHPESFRRDLWPKGSSGNAAGTKRGSVSLAAAIKRLLLAEPEELDQVARALVDGAIAGDVACCRLLFERLDGHRSNSFFSVNVDNSDRRTVSVSPQVLSEIAESRRKYEEQLQCR